MSETAVRSLITIRAALERIWLKRKIGSKGDFGAVFFELLARQDRDLAETFLSPERDPAAFPDKRIAIDWHRFQSDFCHECTIQADGVDHLQARAWIAPAFYGVPVSLAPRMEGSSQCAAQATVPSTTTRTRASPIGGPIFVAKPVAWPKSSPRQVAFEDAIDAAPTARFGYRLVAAPSHGRPPPQSRACWWALVVGLGEANQGPIPSAPQMGPPSTSGLSEELLLLWASLLKVHARLIARERKMAHRRSETTATSL